jgi:hypothetical protein
VYTSRSVEGNRPSRGGRVRVRQHGRERQPTSGQRGIRRKYRNYASGIAGACGRGAKARRRILRHPRHHRRHLGGHDAAMRAVAAAAGWQTRIVARREHRGQRSQSEEQEQKCRERAPHLQKSYTQRESRFSRPGDNALAWPDEKLPRLNAAQQHWRGLQQPSNPRKRKPRKRKPRQESLKKISACPALRGGDMLRDQNPLN